MKGRSVAVLTQAGVFAGRTGPTLLLLAEQTPDGGLDALLLGSLVERVLAAVTAARVAALTVLQSSDTTDGNGSATHRHMLSQRRAHTRYTHTHTVHTLCTQMKTYSLTHMQRYATQHTHNK